VPRNYVQPLQIRQAIHNIRSSDLTGGECSVADPDTHKRFADEDPDLDSSHCFAQVGTSARISFFRYFASSGLRKNSGIAD